MHRITVAVTIVQNRAANPAAPASTLKNEISSTRTDIEVPCRQAIVLLPDADAWRLAFERHGGWLSRGKSIDNIAPVEPLQAVLEELGLPLPDGGLAALRLWGQSGTRPTAWVAAAEPVYLQALLDRLRLHAMPQVLLSPDERRDLFELLNSESGDGRRAFSVSDPHAYLLGGEPFATAACSSQRLDGLEPDAFLPAGPDSAEHDRLTGELQLLLHDAGFNRSREERGLPPINSIWFWGGGVAPRQRPMNLPPLIGTDALFHGYWTCAMSPVEGWCPDAASTTGNAGGFVAVVPEAFGGTRDVSELLSYAKGKLLRGQIRRLSLLGAHGRLLRVHRADLLAFWRRRQTSPPREVGQ
jgi:hypothetical protein